MRLCFTALRKNGRIKGYGLRGRRLGPGRYRFRRNDGLPLNHLIIQVEILEPWSSEKTMMVIHDSLELTSMLIEVPRFTGYVCNLTFDSFEVRVLGRPKVKTMKRALYNEPVCKDAGFAVTMIFSSERGHRCRSSS